MKGKVFTAQEVQAIIAGNKTMFREVAKSKPLIKRGSDYLFDDNGKIVFQKDCCPYQVGQKIFCKESFAEVEVGAGMGYNSGKQKLYKAVDDYDVKWKPAQHMKQEHSRLTLQIKEIRVERLADISEEDARMEGMLKDENIENLDGSPCYIINFRKEWKKNYGIDNPKSWEANPWVWSIQFEVVK